MPTLVEKKSKLESICSPAFNKCHSVKPRMSQTVCHSFAYIGLHYIEEFWFPVIPDQWAIMCVHWNISEVFRMCITVTRVHKESDRVQSSTPMYTTLFSWSEMFRVSASSCQLERHVQIGWVARAAARSTVCLNRNRFLQPRAANDSSQGRRRAGV